MLLVHALNNKFISFLNCLLYYTLVEKITIKIWNENIKSVNGLKKIQINAFSFSLDTYVHYIYSKWKFIGYKINMYKKHTVFIFYFCPMDVYFPSLYTFNFQTIFFWWMEKFINNSFLDIKKKIRNKHHVHWINKRNEKL